MAGSYPDAAGERIAYDEDGTVVTETNSIAGGTFQGAGLFTGMILPPVEMSVSSLQDINDESSTDFHRSAGGVGAVDYGYAWIWPEKRDIFGFYGYICASDGGLIAEIHTSTDSRNGVTGTFTTEAAAGGVSDSGYATTELMQPNGDFTWSVEHSYREFINPLNSTGTTCTRMRWATNKTVGGNVDKSSFRAAHWYGSISDGANPDRLLFIDNDTGLEYDEVQDWGDIPRGTVHDKDIYLLNNSATLSASSNVMTFEGLHEDSYTWYTIKDNSSTGGFSTQLTVDGPLSPGARYPTSTSLTVRLTVADDENLGPAAARIQLATGTWA